MSDTTCAYCERRPGSAQDHVVPRSRGGPDTPNNIVMACMWCNSQKSDRLPSEWLGARAPKRVLDIEGRVSRQVEVLHRNRRGRRPERRDEDPFAERPAYNSKSDPFDTWVQLNGERAPSDVVDAAIFVHDTLECAQRIALATFGKNHRPDVVLRIYDAIERRTRQR